MADVHHGKLQIAIAHHQHGNLEEAKKLYVEILKASSRHFDATHLSAVLAAQCLRYDEAILHFKKAIKIRPEAAVVHFNYGVLLADLKRFEDAVTCFTHAIKIKADYEDAIMSCGHALRELKRLDEALSSYEKAILINPRNGDAIYKYGLTLNDLGRFDDAIKIFDEALRLAPDHAEAWNSKGQAFQDIGNLEEALASFNAAINITPDYFEALNNRGIILTRLKQYDVALMDYERALEISKISPEVYFNRGVVLGELKRFDKALISYGEAVALKDDYFDAIFNMGNSLKELKFFEESLASYDKALTLKPACAEVLYNRGNTLQELGRFEEALASYDRAIEEKQDYAEAWNNRGLILQKFGNNQLALECFEKAAFINPVFVEALNNCGIALQKQKSYSEALAYYDKGILLSQQNVELLSNRGALLEECKRYDEALENFDKVLLLKPDLNSIYGAALHLRMKLSDWRDIESLHAKLELDIRNKRNSTDPFPVIGIFDDPDLQLMTARQYIENRFPYRPLSIPFAQKALDGRIRIGYFSSDFHSHATAYLMAELFELHDRNRFELFGFSFGPDPDDEMRGRIKSTFDHFIDVRFQGDQEVAELARKLGIDIAVDLKGFTQDSRTAIFALRCAPLQVNYIGYPATMGAEYIDYIVADETLVPNESKQFYSEKIIYLPDSYQVNDSKRKISEQKYTRSQLGLPERAFVFCCFNGSFKITPAIFDAWMKILHSVEGSVLWLLDDNATSSFNLRREAELRGISPERLIFAPRMKLNDHLARHRAADLFLDTLPCNAHTTASDALWAGLPVLTQIGRSFSGRVAASLLNAVGLSELITATSEEYERLAIRLALHPEELNALKQRLADNKQSSKLFDTSLYVKHLETAYVSIYERHLSGLDPDHIFVEACR